MDHQAGFVGSDAPITLDRRTARTLAGFAVVGTLAILVGGAVAAAARPAEWDQGSWAAAYLVLPAGLGTWVGGLALALLPRRGDGLPDADVRAPLFLLAWILGNTGVLVGNLLDVPAVLAIGSVLLLAVLIGSAIVLFRNSPRGAWLTAYLVGVAVLIGSVPIGLVLAGR